MYVWATVWVCMQVCKSLSTYEGTQGWVAQAATTTTSQPGASGCADLGWEPFCGIYNIVPRKKLLEQLCLCAWTCLCALCTGLHTPLPLGAMVQGLWYFLGRRLSHPLSLALLEPQTEQSLTEADMDRPVSQESHGTEGDIQPGQCWLQRPQWECSRTSPRWRLIGGSSKHPATIPCYCFVSGLFPSFSLSIRMI